MGYVLKIDKLNGMKKVMLRLCWLTILTSSLMSFHGKKSKQKAYTEDLSSYRMKFKNKKKAATLLSPKKEKKKRQHHNDPDYAITSQLDALLERMQMKNKQVKYIKGYTIQLYAGNSRTMALAAKNQLYRHYPDARPEIHYERPNYTVRLGKFLDKIEAYSMYGEIKKLLPHAIIRPAYFPNKPNNIHHEQRNQGDNQEAGTR